MPVLPVLEDDEGRRTAMREAWNDAELPLTFFATAAEMIRFLTVEWDRVAAVSLDHDLEMIEGAPGARFDPGSGRDVADFLAGRSPAFRVVVASTNVPASVGMVAVLEESGWSVERITPYGDLEWVDEVWLPAMKSAVGGR